MKIIRNLFIITLIFELLGCKSTSDTTKIGNDNIIEKRIISNSFDDKKTQEENNINANYEVITTGSYGKGGYTVIIRNNEQLKRFNQNFYKYTKQITPIDFSKKAIVAVNAGEFNTGGYSIHLQSSKKENNVLRLVFFVKGPSPNEMVTMALTNPYIVIQVDVDKNTKIEVNLLGAKGRANPLMELE